jgi:prolyl-tRNA editing enzyme YbaK/EbsC (Cys-tRNA(Pro) deacylase)
MTETLHLVPARERTDLLATPVAAALGSWTGATPVDAVEVAEIDPAVADTAEFCDRYGIALEDSANCVVVAGRRGGTTTYTACVVLATTRVDVNGAVRRQLDVRKASFAPMDDAVGETGMEHGGITPVGLPASWPLLVDPAVVARDLVVVGSGLRRSKILLPGAALAELPGATVVDGLGRAPDAATA